MDMIVDIAIRVFIINKIQLQIFYFYAHTQLATSDSANSYPVLMTKKLGYIMKHVTVVLNHWKSYEPWSHDGICSMAWIIYITAVFLLILPVQNLQCIICIMEGVQLSIVPFKQRYWGGFLNHYRHDDLFSFMVLDKSGFH